MKVVFTGMLLAGVVGATASIPGYAKEPANAIAASLLGTPEDRDWNLESLVSAQKPPGTGVAVEHGDQIESKEKTVSENENIKSNDPQRLRQQIRKINSALVQTQREFKAFISDKRSDSRQENKTEAIVLALKEKNNILENLKKQMNESAEELRVVKNNLSRSEHDNQTLRDALNKSRQALKEKTDKPVYQRKIKGATIPSTLSQKQAYMAGIMMAQGLNQKINSWEQVGVKTDITMFYNGIVDGIEHRLRLKVEDARHAQNTFMEAVRNGVEKRLAEAEAQLQKLANGRKPIKSAEGISWYRIRTGKPVVEGSMVKLSMTEKVKNGKEVSRVPPIILRPGDNLPVVVKQGMYLPGEGGEVVAYALARTVYGDLPLPSGVQPFTLMEYHLTGLKLDTETH